MITRTLPPAPLAILTQKQTVCVYVCFESSLWIINLELESCKSLFIFYLSHFLYLGMYLATWTCCLCSVPFSRWGLGKKVATCCLGFTAPLPCRKYFLCVLYFRTVQKRWGFLKPAQPPLLMVFSTTLGDCNKISTDCGFFLNIRHVSNFWNTEYLLRKTLCSIFAFCLKNLGNPNVEKLCCNLWNLENAEGVRGFVLQNTLRTHFVETLQYLNLHQNKVPPGSNELNIRWI